MKAKTPLTLTDQIKIKRARLHYLQTMNRVDLRSYRAGCEACKEVGRELQALIAERKVTSRAQYKKLRDETNKDS